MAGVMTVLILPTLATGKRRLVAFAAPPNPSWACTPRAVPRSPSDWHYPPRIRAWLGMDGTRTGGSPEVLGPEGCGSRRTSRDRCPTRLAATSRPLRLLTFGERSPRLPSLERD